MRSAGADIWIDQLDVPPGKHWDRVTEEALEGCERLLVVLSPSSVNSDNVMDEVSFALENKKQIFPVLYRNCKVPFRLRRIQYSDFATDYEKGFTQLLRALEIGVQTETSEQHSVNSFSYEAVKKMLRERNFYDQAKNEKGVGWSSRFEKIDSNGEKLIVDHSTKLIWRHAGSAEEMTFLDAEEYIRNLNEQNFAGNSDWRLPKLDEANVIDETGKKARRASH